MPEIIWQDENIIVFNKSQGEDTEAISKEKGYFPIHRLDKDTGGLLVMAKNSQSAAILSEEIREGVFKKEYLAVFEGKKTEKAGRYEDFLFHDKTKNRTYVVKSQRRGVKKAILDYNIVAENENIFLSKITLLTGRTHQIRCQFASRGNPVYGDKKYGSKNKGKLALWSHKIIFTHPADKRTMEFILNPPSDGIWGEFTGCF